MTKYKRIIFFSPNIEDGGIEKNIVILSNYLIKKKLKVEILCHKISPNVKKKLNKNIILTNSNIKNFNFFLNKRINNSLNCFFYLAFIKKIDEASLILSFQDHPLAIIASKLKKIKCAIRIANHPIGSLKYFNNKILFYMKLFIKIFFYQFANKIISNSRETNNFFKKKILFKNKTCFIYNPGFVKNNQKIINTKRNNILLSVGRLHKQKNFTLLLNAFKKILDKFPKYKLIIIGKGPEKKKILTLAKKLSIYNRIKLYGFCDPKKFYKTSKLFILSSLFEGLPNVLLESQNYQLPIVSTNCKSGPKEILKDEKYGFLSKVNNINSLVKKTCYALDNYELAQSRAKKGYQDLNRFNSNAQCENYIKVLSKL